MCDMYVRNDDAGSSLSVKPYSIPLDQQIISFEVKVSLKLTGVDSMPFKLEQPILAMCVNSQNV